MNDIAQTLEESLDRDGNGGMRAPFQFADGSEGSPGATWINEPTTGFYRAAIGDLRVTILGSDLFRWNSGNAQVWVNGAWADLVYEGGPGGMPDGTNLYDTLSWNNSTSEWIPNDALSVNYNSGDVTVERDLSVGRALNVQTTLTVGTSSSFSGDMSVVGNITVSGTVDGVDVSQLNVNFLNHVNNANVHYSDAPADGRQYARRNNAWTEVAASGEVIAPGTSPDQSLRWDGSSWSVSTTFQIKDGQGAISVGGGQVWLGTTDNMSIKNNGGSMDMDVSGVNQMTIQNGRVGVGTTPNAASRLDVNGDIYTESQPLVLNAKRFAVVTALPGTPDADTIYFLTG
jgi:hypothetical protein